MAHSKNTILIKQAASFRRKMCLTKMVGAVSDVM